MRKVLIALVLCAVAALSIAAGSNIDQQSLKLVFNGPWLPSVDPANVGLSGFSTLTNMRPRDGRIEIVGGASRVNSTALTTPNEIDGLFQYWADNRTTQSYLLAHTSDSGELGQVRLHKSVPPATGDFEATSLHTDSSAGLDARFGELPFGIGYANGEETYQYWGDEGPVGGFFLLSDISVTLADLVFNDAAKTCVTTEGNFYDSGFRAGHTVTVTGGANDGLSYEISTISTNGKTLTFVTAPATETLGTDQTVEVADRLFYAEAVEYTEAVNNSLITTGNVVDVYGGLDADTLLLLHGDGSPGGSVTDSSDTGHTVTASGDADIQNDLVKFGSGALIFDGDGDYLYTSDNAAWNYGTDPLTIDTWAFFDTLDAVHILYVHAASPNHVLFAYDGFRRKLWFIVTSGGTNLIHESVSWTPNVSTFYHLAVVRGWGGGANSWAITVNGAAVHTFSDSGTLPDLAGEVWIGMADTTTDWDHSANGHVLSFGSDAEVTDSEVKFGSGSLVLDGTDDFVSIPNSADWDVAKSNATSNDYTIAFWVKHDDHVGTEAYIAHGADANNTWLVSHTHGSGIRFAASSLGSAVIVGDYSGEITDTDWHHIVVRIVGTGTTKKIAVYQDGAQTSYNEDSDNVDFTGLLYLGVYPGGVTSWFDGKLDDVQIVAGNPYSLNPNAGLTDTYTVPTTHASSGATTKLLLPLDTKEMDGVIDEYRISDVARWTTTFAPPDRAYNEAQRRFRILSARPLQGAKFYINSANTTTSTLSGYVWNGRGFSALSLTDGTASGGISMAQTGTVTWGSTSSNAKPLIFEGRSLYCYEFELSDGGFLLYQATADGGFEPINDIWSGEYEVPFEVRFVDNSASQTIDYTVKAINASDTTVPWGLELDAMTSSDEIIIGFERRVHALDIAMLTDKMNANASSITVYYRNGPNWVSVGTVHDGAMSEYAKKCFGRSGVIWWYPPGDGEETKYSPYGTPGYFYRIKVSATISGTAGDDDPEVVVDLINGIPVQYTLQPTVGIGTFRGRPIRWGFTAANEGNRIDYGVTNTANAFNGADSSMDGIQSLFIGNGEALTQVEQMFNRYGNNIYVTLTAAKKRGVYLVYGEGPEDFKIFPISELVGCPAPHSFMTIPAGGEIAEGVRWNVQMWVDYSGPQMFNGSTVEPIPGVENFFDPNHEDYLGTAEIESAVGWPDYTYHEANWVIGDVWLVYRWKEKRWFKKQCPNYPIAGASVRDDNGQRYSYTGHDNGYLVRQENTATWDDSTSIYYEWETGDFLPTNSMFDVTRLDFLTMLMARTEEDLTLTVRHMVDGDDTFSLYLVSDGSGGWDYYMVSDGSGGWLYYGFSAGENVMGIDLDAGSSRIVMPVEALNEFSVGRLHRLNFSGYAGATTGAEVNAIKAMGGEILYHLDHKRTYE